MDTQKLKALLVGIQLPRMTDEELSSSLQELRRLVDTLGYEVVGELTQKRVSESSATVVGQGKLRELAAWTGGPGHVISTVPVKKHKAAQTEEVAEVEEVAPGKADVIIFDCDLSPSQLRNLESATGVKVFDRTGVIIEIFSRHAKTKTAKLQVEIARLNYLAPRLRETGVGEDRSGGGLGGKGAGESKQELDRRRIRDRIKELKEELGAVQNESSVRSTRRAEENSVALIGYTNAGKSSLMRAMTGSEILVADKLFATLDTTIRPMQPEALPKVLISDTVGFIKKLPHDLVASFRSTLDEALNADLLLYVVDASDPTFRTQLEVTKKVMLEIGATDYPSWLILNKRDRLSQDELQNLAKEYPEAIFLSTRSKEDLSLLREQLLRFFEGDMVDASLIISYTVQGAIGEIRRHMRVLGETYSEQGVTLAVRARPDVITRIKSKYHL